MKRSISLPLLLAAFISLSAQTSVVHHVPGSSIPAGVVYYLPRMAVEVRATAECLTEKPGPFYQYAERYLAVKNVIVKEKREWTLKDVRISSRPLPDSSRCFSVAVTGKDVAHRLSLSPSGIITGVNIGEPLFPHDGGKPADAGHPHRHKVKHRRHAPSPDFDMSVLGEEALVANSIPKMAEMAARQIYRIRESRTALLSGEMEHTFDGRAVEAMLENMDRIENELTALFVGKRAVEKQVARYEYCPEEDVDNHVLFRISVKEGLLPADNLIGSPVYISVRGEYLTAPLLTKKEDKARKGLYYVVPGSAEIRVTDNAAIDRSRTLPMPQFGYTTFLPAALTDSQDISIRFSGEGTILYIGR